MIARLGLAVSGIFRRLAPDPLVLAILLTVLTALLALTVTRTPVDEIGRAWSGGLWGLLAFSMQMCLILVTGHALASSPPVASIIRRLADLPRTGRGGAALVAFVAMLLGLFNWGLGLIAGALIARDVGRSLQRRRIPHHYPLIVAAGYLGLMVWHGGLSGSAPLKVANETDFADILKGLDLGITSIPLDQTIFSGMNLVISLGAVAIAAALVLMLTPKDAHELRGLEHYDPPRDPEPTPRELHTLPDWLEHTPVLTVLLAAPLAWFALNLLLPDMPGRITSATFRTMGPNEVVMVMLGLGLICHGTPRRYADAIGAGASGCAGIILQFPLYAGIMGLMKDSGLTAELASTIASTTNETTLPIFTFVSAGVVNLFVPSGGGQWAVQGPIAMQAAHDVGASPAKMVLAVAYGDQLTNMLQPFWALPLLAITGMRARDIVGYTAIIMLAAGAWMVLGLLFF